MWLGRLERFRNKSKWCEFILAVLCGVLATLTLPPVHFFPLLIPAFSGLILLLVYSKDKWRAFWNGWWFGLGYFASGLYWFAYPLLIEAERFAWMIPFAVFGLPSVLAIYSAMAGFIFRQLMLQRRHPIICVFLFASVWLTMELLRGYLFTGFPWNLIAESWTVSLPMLQPLSLLGSYGYSWWTVLMAALPAVALWPVEQRQHRTTTIALCLCFTMIMLPFGYGYLRLQKNPIRYTQTVLKLVQPSIPQVMKMQPQQRVARIETHVALSKQQPGEPVADILLWSESSYPFFLEPYSPPVSYIVKEALGPKSHLIMGADIFDRSTENIFNSLVVLQKDGGLSAHYDKFKLVPFGEYAPLRWLLPIDKIAPGMKDFSAGNPAEPIKVEGVPPFLPLICYEVVFPELSRSATRPEWLLNVTNDSWFGISSGPYQHFSMSVMRAVEQGLPLVRVANNGISAVIDGTGRILTQIPLDVVGTAVTNLPQPLPQTVYARYGDNLIYSLIFIAAASLLFWRRKS